jgi:hypothetical protein
LHIFTGIWLVSSKINNTFVEDVIGLRSPTAMHVFDDVFYCSLDGRNCACSHLLYMQTEQDGRRISGTSLNLFTRIWLVSSRNRQLISLRLVGHQSAFTTTMHMFGDVLM